MTVSLSRLVLGFGVRKIPMNLVKFLLRAFKVQRMCAKSYRRSSSKKKFRPLR